jgi:hypothetical protein
MRILVSLIALWIFVFSVGCQSIPVEADAPVSPTQGDITQMVPSLSTPSTSGLEILIEKAKEDLAKRLSISIAEIKLVETKAVVWRDASLGCPKPGIDYIQMETPGYSVVLETSGKTYNYHTNEVNRVILCNTQ